MIAEVMDLSTILDEYDSWRHFEDVVVRDAEMDRLRLEALQYQIQREEALRDRNLLREYARYLEDELKNPRSK